MPAGVRTDKTKVLPVLDVEAGYDNMQELVDSVIYIDAPDDKDE